MPMAERTTATPSLQNRDPFSAKGIDEKTGVDTGLDGVAGVDAEEVAIAALCGVQFLGMVGLDAVWLVSGLAGHGMVWQGSKTPY